MFYWMTNGSAIVLTFMFFLIAFAIEKFSYKRFTIKNIAILGLLSALSIVLTNVVGYSRIFGFQIMFGNFILFLTGMIFGPLIGVVIGIVSDGVGAIIYLGGVYHAGFMLTKVLYGFLGSMVFIWKTNKYWIFNVIWLFALVISINLFLINPISLWSIGYVDGYVYASFIKHLILFPIELTLYSIFTIISFKILWLLLKNTDDRKNVLWVSRHGDIKYISKPKITEYEKLTKK